MVSISAAVPLTLASLALAGSAYAVGAAQDGGVSPTPPGASSGAQSTGVATVASVSDPRGTITMTGSGQVTGVPDQVSFHLSVTRTATDLTTALDDASSTSRRVLAALAKAGVERRDTQTTGLSMNPVYRYFSNQAPLLTGYRVRQSYSVLVRDLKSGGGAVAAAVEAGGNAARVSGIALKIGDKQALITAARKAAVAEATAKATLYAEQTGQTLGGVYTLSEGKQAGRPTRDLIVNGRAAALYGTLDSAALAVRSGREDVGVHVTIVWRLE